MTCSEAPTPSSLHLLPARLSLMVGTANLQSSLRGGRSREKRQTHGLSKVGGGGAEGREMSGGEKREEKKEKEK
jgi:hypothetical protein